MEEWQLDFEWLRIQHKIKEQISSDKLPDLNAILFLIGIQELGRWRKVWTKEEKQDLMHIAICRLLSIEGYYEFIGRDEDGWPHWKQTRKINSKGMDNQENLLKMQAIKYFDDLEAEGSVYLEN